MAPKFDVGSYLVGVKRVEMGMRDVVAFLEGVICEEIRLYNERYVNYVGYDSFTLALMAKAERLMTNDVFSAGKLISLALLMEELSKAKDLGKNPVKDYARYLYLNFTILGKEMETASVTKMAQIIKTRRDIILVLDILRKRFTRVYDLYPGSEVRDHVDDPEKWEYMPAPIICKMLSFFKDSSNIDSVRKIFVESEIYRRIQWLVRDYSKFDTDAYFTEWGLDKFITFVKRKYRCEERKVGNEVEFSVETKATFIFRFRLREDLTDDEENKVYHLYGLVKKSLEDGSIQGIYVYEDCAEIIKKMADQAEFHKPQKMEVFY